MKTLELRPAKDGGYLVSEVFGPGLGASLLFAGSLKACLAYMGRTLEPPVAGEPVVLEDLIPGEWTPYAGVAGPGAGVVDPGRTFEYEIGAGGGAGGGGAPSIAEIVSVTRKAFGRDPENPRETGEQINNAIQEDMAEVEPLSEREREGLLTLLTTTSGSLWTGSSWNARITPREAAWLLEQIERANDPIRAKPVVNGIWWALERAIAAEGSAAIEVWGRGLLPHIVARYGDHHKQFTGGRMLPDATSWLVDQASWVMEQSKLNEGDTK